MYAHVSRTWRMCVWMLHWFLKWIFTYSPPQLLNMKTSCWCPHVKFASHVQSIPSHSKQAYFHTNLSVCWWSKLCWIYKRLEQRNNCGCNLINYWQSINCITYMTFAHRCTDPSLLADISWLCWVWIVIFVWSWWCWWMVDAWKRMYIERHGDLNIMTRLDSW